MQRTTPPLMSIEQASERFDKLVYAGVFELIDLGGLLELEHGLWQALLDAGVPRAEAPTMSAQLIARALTRFGAEHIKLAENFDGEQLASAEPVARFKS